MPLTRQGRATNSQQTSANIVLGLPWETTHTQLIGEMSRQHSGSADPPGWEGGLLFSVLGQTLEPHPQSPHLVSLDLPLTLLTNTEQQERALLQCPRKEQWLIREPQIIIKPAVQNEAGRSCSVSSW